MATSNQPSARFRSATEFPKTVDHVSLTEANKLYIEMRECLIFTNRSRSQLMRRNEEHKQSIASLRNDLARFQAAIDQLNFEKQALTLNNQAVITDLQQEIGNMSGHLDLLSKAFEDVEGINNPMNVMAMPNRFIRFWQALKALIMWWREEQGYEDDRQLLNHSSQNSSDDRIENPQMHSDPASVQRSLRDK